jgi:hypothetical protein
MKNLLLGLFCLLNFNLASAQTITFDDLAGDFNPVPEGYAGLSWNSSNLTGVVDVNQFLVPGVDYTGIRNNALFNAYGYQAPNTTIIRTTNGGTFDFLSGFWSAGITGNADISFEGYVNSQLAFSSATFSLSGSGVTPVTLNWFGLDSLKILSTSSIWIADNLEVNVLSSPVPEPETYGMLIVGLGLMTAVIRRRKNVL